MIGPTDLFHPPPTPHLKTFQVFLTYCPKRNTFNTEGQINPSVLLDETPGG
jgi:hypothetical protein